MSDPRLLTAAELELMHVLWQRGASTVAEVQAGLAAPPRAYTTVATLLKILDDKGFAKSLRDGRRLVVLPVVSKAAYEATAVADVVQRVFSGNAAALVRTLAATESLTSEERAAVEALLKAAP